MTTTKTLPKLATLLFLSTLLIPTVVSCTRSQTEETPTPPPYDVDTYGDLESISPEDRVIILWHSYSGQQEGMLLTLIDEFNVDNQWDITVLAEYAGDSAETHHKILDRIGGGALPDVVAADQHRIAAYADRQALVAVDPYLESERWGVPRDARDEFLPIALSTETWPQLDGRYGWPLYQSLSVLYYNEDWLADLGYAAPPGTWEEFEEMACAASDPEAETVGFEFSADASTFSSLLLNHGGRMLDEQGRRFDFADEAGSDALARLQRLLAEGCAKRKTERLGDQVDFGQGRVLFNINSTSAIPGYQSSVVEGAGFNWTVAPLPTTLDAPTIQAEGSYLAILESTPEKQLAAWLFLTWLSADQQQARWARATHTLPIRVSAVERLEDTPTSSQYAKALAFLSYETITQPGVSSYGPCREAMEEMMIAIANLDSAEEWLSNTQAVCTASME